MKTFLGYKTKKKIAVIIRFISNVIQIFNHLKIEG